ncbi:hypothetical protein [Acinetobacter sp. TTH0-4]|uniref:hypothetical protein n=1 Tax=Acinetobacter sp. TTH0-4 TaxID=1646498 RepID=UPI0009D74C08|nr:hypothetical protein [Acinetobacter sp. TTH0-4]
MKNEPNLAIFHQAFSSKAKIAEVLPNVVNPTSDVLVVFKEAIDQLGGVLSQCGRGNIEDQYRAFHTAISIFLLLVEWKQAIRKAEFDAQRFLASAKLQASEIDHSLSYVMDSYLQEFLKNVDSLQSVTELAGMQKYLSQWELPLLLFANTRSNIFNKSDYTNEKNNASEKLQSTVAFLKFEIDGKPAEQYEPYRVCRRVNILRDYPDDKIKIYP